MCGIVGVVRFDPRERVDAATLQRMASVLTHRGPDGEGLVADGPVGLAHRRLAIVDLAGGAQPMSNEDGTVLIVCNGEIYNHPELSRRLRAAGHRYRTRCDTETILHLYEDEGDACVDTLRGMFAFGLWDARRRRLLLARDPLGIKPLYYTVADGGLAFASEIKSLVSSGIVRPAFRHDVLPELLAAGFLAGDRTLFDGVRKLPPGHALTWSREEGVRVRPYWKPASPAGRSGRSTREEALALRERLQAAVRSHLMSDVPVGLFLSGGIDSSALAALMAPVSDEPLRTFSVGFDEPGMSELAEARRVAAEVGAIHRDIVISHGEFFRVLPRLVWHEDEPMAFSAGVPLYFVSRLAAQHVKVVLTGEGSDELFSGYNRYRIAAVNERLHHLVWRHVPRKLRSGARAMVPFLPRRLRRAAARSFLGATPDLRSSFYDAFAVFPLALQRTLLANAGGGVFHDPYATPLDLAAEAEGGLIDRLLRADLQTYLVELLMKQDRMSMAASIESRVPYLDRDLVDYATALPSRYKLRGLTSKAVLRDAVRDIVPAAIIGRRKMGFPVPLSRWFRGPARRVVEELVLAPRAAARGLFRPAAIRRIVAENDRFASEGERLWLLVNLEIWQRIFLEGEDPARIAKEAHA